MLEFQVNHINSNLKYDRMVLLNPLYLERTTVYFEA